jgi:rSAM/selenodomain-associated transferase 1
VKKSLIIFAREPVPGQVKTRLAASIGELAAAELYETMLLTVLHTCSTLVDVETVVYWACEEKSLPSLAERYQCNSRYQNGGDLGQRMAAAFADMFAEGYDRCCIIGSDAPDLPLSYILQAYRLLELPQTDVVFGPSMDGGYYLLGQRRVWPQLFTDIPWSSKRVLEQSLKAAQNSGLSVTLLPQWQDIDTVEDLKAYQKRMETA